MLKKSVRKLKSNTGASLMVALLYFLVCAVVGSVILTAAVSSAGRASKADTDANLQRYSLEAAAKLIDDELTTTGTSSQGSSTTPDITLKQQWYFDTVQCDFVNTGSVCADKDDGNYYFGVGTYSVDKPARLSYGDYVVRIDQDSATGTDTYSNTSMELNDNTDVSKKTYQWQDDWTGTLNSLSTSNTRYSYYINTKANANTIYSIGSLSTLRALMAEGIYRNYWYPINNTTADKIQQGGTSPSDPWNGTTPDLSWSSVVGTTTYHISTGNKPLEITTSDPTLKTVYADVSMDQNFVLTIHLYCEADEANQANSAAGIQQMYLTYRPVSGMPSLTYQNSKTTTQENPYGTYHVYTFVKQGSTSLSKQVKNAEDELKSIYPGYAVKNVKKEVSSPDSDQVTYSFDLYQEVVPTKTTTVTERTVTFTLSWGKVETSQTASNQ